MQVSFRIDDKVYEALVRGAKRFQVDITDVLEYGASLAAVACEFGAPREPAKVSATWHVDPTTKAVTKVEPPDSAHVTATEVQAFSHPLAKPGDWDRAVARAMRNPPAPT